MRIVYVVPDYTNSGGMERVLSTKVEYWITHGHEVGIVAYEHEDVPPFFYFHEKAKVYHLNLGKKRLNRTKRFIQELEQVLEDIKPDVTVSMARDLGFKVYLAADGSKKVLESHFSKYRSKTFMPRLEHHFLLKLIPWMYRLKEYRDARCFDRFVLLTHEDKLSWGGLDNVTVISNYLSFLPTAQAVCSAKKVIALARLSNQKGLDMLIDIWKMIIKDYPGWKLELVGGGGKKEMLLNKIQKLGLADSISILAPIKDVHTTLVNSSVYVLSSRYEGFGLALTEGMACGLPAVAFACKCGPRDIVADGEDGFLVEPFDKKKFAYYLSQLMNDEELRKTMGSKAAKNMLRFSKEEIMGQWTRLFESLLA